LGALLVDGDGKIVVRSENTVLTRRDCTGHAETNVMRVATDSEVLRGCTLYTSTEPCAMCAGAIHWGNVRRVVFALGQENLRGIAGGNSENAILAIPCRRYSLAATTRSRSAVRTSRSRHGAVHGGFWD